MNTYPEHKLVEHCLLQIEAKLGWGSAKLWHNDVFNELSEIIHKQTNVLLSATTLKRVWGKVNYNSAPSISTLNTLAQFAGYNNWRDFRSNATPEKRSLIARKVIPNLGIIMTSAAIMTLVFVSFYSMIGSENGQAAITDHSKIKFTSRPVSRGLPNSVVFDLAIDDIRSDSIYIQQFWDPAKTIKLKSGQRQATGIYYYPGYFRARLLVDGEIIKEHKLFITSNDWMATVDYEPVPKYIDNEQLLSDKLALPSSVISEIGASEKPLVSSFHLVKDFGDILGDDIVINTSIQNTYNDKWAVCETVRIVILGTEGALIVPFSIPGCASDLGLMLNDVYYSGKEHDLSAFGIDLSDDADIKIKLENKIIHVYVNDDEIYSGRYNESIGNFVGIRYRFLGAGEVKTLKIHDDKGNVVLNTLAAQDKS